MYIFILLTTQIAAEFYVISGGKITMMAQFGVLHFLHHISRILFSNENFDEENQFLFAEIL